MILVDTSIWIDHLRHGNKGLAALLGNVEVLAHPFVIGELACGNLKNRREIISLLNELPRAAVTEHAEVLELIESRRLMGNGIGYVDAHLIASALLSGSPLWTGDKRLRSVSAAMGILF
ncbi:MAG: type II toxin-antitoxin system VapC family toxin [Proteobacteria bacterium]|nr:type II toxin-antitoxin system VapC family toxin [Pseudomonadota bacterium]